MTNSASTRRPPPVSSANPTVPQARDGWATGRLGPTKVSRQLALRADYQIEQRLGANDRLSLLKKISNAPITHAGRQTPVEQGKE